MSSVNTKKHLDVQVEFLGAVGGVVTGSSTLVTIKRGGATKRILIDFGLFQGEHEHLNEERVILPEEIDYIFLTHAHLDHCGGLPILYKCLGENQPYAGKIYGSAETLEQAKHILNDAAKLNRRKQETKLNELKEISHVVKKETHRLMKNDSSWKATVAVDTLHGSLEEKFSEILYLPEDAAEAISHFTKIPVNVEFSLCEGIDVRLVPNSHINGSTMIEIFTFYADEQYGIAFTGDIGKRKTPLYKEMIYGKEYRINSLVLESLHGTEEPTETFVDSVRAIKKIIKRSIKEQKNVYIPVFALDRSAMFVMFMNQLMKSGLKFKCFFDSPLGERELLAYMRSYGTEEALPYMKAEDMQKSHWFDYDKPYPFELDKIDFPEDYNGHIRIVKREGPNVVLTSSCMGYGGRVLDYFDQHIQDEDAIFIFPGYLPDDSPSKMLLEARPGEIVEVNGNRYIKHCEAYHLEGFSSHGYFEDKLEIIARYCDVDTILLNHGDAKSLHDLEEELPKHTSAAVLVPEANTVYHLL